MVAMTVAVAVHGGPAHLDARQGEARPAAAVGWPPLLWRRIVVRVRWRVGAAAETVPPMGHHALSSGNHAAAPNAPTTAP